jgi:hypothetical protein
VAELADAPDLGSGGRKALGVRLPPFAPASARLRRATARRTLLGRRGGGLAKRRLSSPRGASDRPEARASPPSRRPAASDGLVSEYRRTQLPAVAARPCRCYHSAPMPTQGPDLYFGVFQRQVAAGGAAARLTRHATAPSSIPGPDGRPLRISTIQASTRAICPACASVGDGGFVSFEDDLRLAYACPECCRFVWIRGS